MMRDFMKILEDVFDPNHLVEMANLPEADTGIAGVIYISTQQGSHAPRIKWFPNRPRNGAPCLVVVLSEEPVIINQSIDAATETATSPALMQWAKTNRMALLDFWQNGTSWTRQEVNAFVEGLEKV
jgi:hypothetical protein